MQRIKPYIYQKPNWPAFEWDAKALVNGLSAVSKLQGKLLGKTAALGFDVN